VNVYLVQWLYTHYVKDALLQLYASCDRKLAEVRRDLFTIISKMLGYPYPGSTLKRRLQSRKGDTLAE